MRVNGSQLEEMGVSGRILGGQHVLFVSFSKLKIQPYKCISYTCIQACITCVQLYV